MKNGVMLIGLAVLSVLMFTAGCRANPQGMTREQRALLEWMRAAGTESNLSIGASKYGGRAAFAIKAMQKGETMAIIPLNLTYYLPKYDYHYTDVGVHFMWRLLDKSDELLPYWLTMPQPGSQDIGLGFSILPPEYGPLVECAPLTDWIYGHQESIVTTWASVAFEATRAGGSLRLLQHVMQLLSNRVFSAVDGGEVMMPLVDMANHEHGCQTTYAEQPCPFDKRQRCVAWYAGTDIEEGEEVCYSYGWLRPDESLLQYGFLVEPPPGEAPDLCVCDVKDFSMQTIHELRNNADGKPPLFIGTPQEMEEELQRLQGRLAALEANNAVAAAWPPAPTDPDGKFLKQLQRLRQIRQAGIRHVIQHLKAKLGRKEDASAPEPDVNPRARRLVALRETAAKWPEQAVE